MGVKTYFGQVRILWKGGNGMSRSTQGDGSFVLFFSSLCCKNFAPGVKKMPRAVREKSSTGIYHVMLRGIGHSGHF